MEVIHFTHGATDALSAFDSRGVRFVPLADGTGDTHLGCAHLFPGATIRSPSLSHAATLLVVHGQVAIRTKNPKSHINLSGGMGGVLRKDERYSLTSETGAILLIIEAEQLAAHPRGLSSPIRVYGHAWPSDPRRQVDCGP
jgi:hypothetical protein